MAFVKNLFNMAKALGKLLLGLDSRSKAFKPHLLGVSEVSLGEHQMTFGEMTAGRRVSRRERNLPLDAFSVKRKLGKGHFTRRLNPRTRHARVSALSSDERALARAQGWI